MRPGPPLRGCRSGGTGRQSPPRRRTTVRSTRPLPPRLHPVERSSTHHRYTPPHQKTRHQKCTSYLTEDNGTPTHRKGGPGRGHELGRIRRNTPAPAEGARESVVRLRCFAEHPASIGEKGPQRLSIGTTGCGTPPRRRGGLRAARAAPRQARIPATGAGDGIRRQAPTDVRRPSPGHAHQTHEQGHE